MDNPLGKKWRHFLIVLGPGLIVMLADTDAGSIITAAQSGKNWGYLLLWLEFLLIPVLFVVQEITVRLAILTGKGHGELIREIFGFRWAILSVLTLTIACLGALLTEFSGMAGVGLMFGIPAWFTMLLTASAMILMVYSGSYRTVERAALCIGAFELIFFLVAYRAKPSGKMMLEAMTALPFANHDFLYLIAANIGAVIMPWMIFYQQSAIVDKGLVESDLRAARWDTAIGAVLTQAVMASVLIATASLNHENHADFNTVGEIAQAVTPILGKISGKILFSLAMVGASMVAAIVVSLTVSWGVGEVFGFKRSLEHQPREAPWFYGIFTVLVLFSALVVASGINLIDLSVGVEVMNSLLLPLVLGFLFLLARRALPESYRLQGNYALLVAAALLLTSAVGVFGAFYGIFV